MNKISSSASIHLIEISQRRIDVGLPKKVEIAKGNKNYDTLAILVREIQGEFCIHFCFVFYFLFIHIGLSHPLSNSYCAHFLRIYGWP